LPNFGVKFDLPDSLADKACSFRESSYGATTATLVLKDGTRIPHVILAGRSVIKARCASDEEQLKGLDPANIADVLPEV
jgi:hypothetical protein